MIKDLGTKIAEGIDKFYKAFQKQRVLKTMEEIEANTNEENIPSALLLSELSNKLSQPFIVRAYYSRELIVKNVGSVETVQINCPAINGYYVMAYLADTITNGHVVPFRRILSGTTCTVWYKILTAGVDVITINVLYAKIAG